MHYQKLTGQYRDGIVFFAQGFRYGWFSGGSATLTLL